MIHRSRTPPAEPVRRALPELLQLDSARARAAADAKVATMANSCKKNGRQSIAVYGQNEANLRSSVFQLLKDSQCARSRSIWTMQCMQVKLFIFGRRLRTVG